MTSLHVLSSACLSWSFVLTRSCTLTLVTKILMRAISNVHTGRISPVGRRFSTPGLKNDHPAFSQNTVQKCAFCLAPDALLFHSLGSKIGVCPYSLVKHYKNSGDCEKPEAEIVHQTSDTIAVWHCSFAKAVC